MKERFCSLIVLGPAAPQTIKLHLSRNAIAVLVLAFVVSFLAAACVAYTYPQPVNAAHRARLAEENNELKLETASAVIGIQKLDEEMAKLEEVSKRIEDLVVPPATGD
jgi:hypothetical protein